MSDADEQALIRRYRSARRDPGLAVLEGFHALKHALRFGAEVIDAVATNHDVLRELGAELASDVAEELVEQTAPISPQLLAELAPHTPRTGVLAIARRPTLDLGELLGAPKAQPLVLLEDPRTMTNVGACVRVAAAAEAAGVLTIGASDPWQPAALRGAAGLHYALPVIGVAELPKSDRPLIAIDPDGTDLRPGELPPRAILAFGTERYGLSEEMLERADARLRIPMRAGVSSLNLATAVAAVLYAQHV